MKRDITLLGAPSAIGIKPYDDGTMRRLDLAPAALRDEGIVRRLDARDLGDVTPPPYRDFVRPAGRVRNEQDVAQYARALAARLADGVHDDAFALVLGGDCSIIFGCLLAARRRHSRVGLVYADAHADFATPELSRSGSAASMCLALAVGRGDTSLARLDGDAPLVRTEDVIVIGRRDEGDAPWYGQDDLRAGPALDLPMAAIRGRAPDAIARLALDRLTQSGVDAFWIHLDADVIDPALVPAVDSPEPDGISIDDLAALAATLAEDPRAIGLDLSIYDPGLDADGTSAVRLATLLEHALRGAS